MTNAERLAAIRKLPCCKCGTTVGIQAAHSNFGEHGKGRGIKADDSYTIPLCFECHKSFDQYKMMNRSESKQWFMLKLGIVDQALNGGWECPF